MIPFVIRGRTVEVPIPAAHALHEVLAEIAPITAGRLSIHTKTPVHVDDADLPRLEEAICVLGGERRIEWADLGPLHEAIRRL